MAGAVLLGDLAVILGALVGVFDQHGDRRAGGRHRLAIGVEHDAGQHLHQIVLAPLRHEAGLSGLALVEPDLQVLELEAEPRRAAVDDAAERRTVAFAPWLRGKGDRMYCATCVPTVAPKPVAAGRAIA